ncbi:MULTISPECIES: ABC transporter ATP-binding protein [unclassified Corallococcus]|uniref:ABC transporter ATP-binding protein n=1 Tax=unclassified Corallococcus TaxID=2685029 RepID=UPI001A8E616C|nr:MULTISPECIES: sn-glycerol-3-phosphate ABC transporter ATP-binding protein UgpC [unclassified Corallococcus]MBN9681098.1 sn-glycerol-3-phosphate ABC transporter ATP-binding protein UgpC [Corallococcus sp. NCSPR001]WAS87308.1 sn-glycerol-3-phosphate ABC transporter ATP-binding protein UgpC [Corallococcus sp. NCRR]
MAGVSFKDVAKRYGDVSVIEGLNLDIRDHEFMVLVGPSGCGKSTALRMIAGLEEISGGTISIGERAVNALPPKDRDVSMVFQNYALYPHMSVRQNLEFGLKIRKTPKPEMDKLVDEAAEILGITHLLDRKPKALSGGQRQRVALGRAIVRKPAVFLFDEPLSNLDAKLRVQMRSEIKKLQHRLQVTSVYVTHDQIEAMTMGHRIAVMKDGKLQQLGTPLEVYEKPVNVFVAQFIGTPPINMLTATLDADGASLTGEGFKLPVPQKLRAMTAGKGGRKVKVGLRPDNVLPAGSAARGESAPAEARVELVEPLGNELIVHARLGDNPLVFRLPPQSTPEPGAALPVTVELESLHLFDAESELRLSV